MQEMRMAARPRTGAALAWRALAVSAVLAIPAAPAAVVGAVELRDAYAAAARAQVVGFAPSVERGRRFFESRHGGEWSCSTCHTADPRGAGRHASTGRSIGPLAPAANARRLTDARKVEKWFTRNCRDVVARECTPGEKADVLAWLASVR